VLMLLVGRHLCFFRVSFISSVRRAPPCTSLHKFRYRVTETNPSIALQRSVRNCRLTLFEGNLYRAYIIVYATCLLTVCYIQKFMFYRIGQNASFRKTLSGEIISVYSENPTEHINTFRGQIGDNSVRAGGTYSYHCALNAQGSRIWGCGMDPSNSHGPVTEASEHGDKNNNFIK